MKKTIMLTLAVAVTLILGVSMALADNWKRVKLTSNTWTKYSGNPVIASDHQDVWNKFKTDPSVIKDGDTYKMWYGSYVGGANTVLAFAVSPDGIYWETHPEPVLRPAGVLESWEGTDVETPSVIKDVEASPEERYKMWYSAWEEETGTYRIGYATSPDGILWTKYPGNPVLDTGNKETWDWDGWTVADPMVLKKGDMYHMWYSGAGDFPEENTWYVGIGYATSPDGIHWTKYPGNPVIEHGPAGSFESKAAGQPSVVFDGSVYHMLYSGWDELEPLWSSQIGYATSNDGIHWTKSSNMPVLIKGQFGEWDADQLVAAAALLDGNVLKVWYTGMNLDSFEIGVGYATGDISTGRSTGLAGYRRSISKR